VNLDIAKLEHGGFEARLMQNGNLPVQALSYGLTENVSISYSYSFLKLMIVASPAGAGKSVIWYDNISIIGIRELML
jgi:hypothetical protein